MSATEFRGLKPREDSEEDVSTEPDTGSRHFPSMGDDSPESIFRVPDIPPPRSGFRSSTFSSFSSSSSAHPRIGEQYFGLRSPFMASQAPFRFLGGSRMQSQPPLSSIFTSTSHTWSSSGTPAGTHSSFQSTTETFSLVQLRDAIARCFRELNWDWLDDSRPGIDSQNIREWQVLVRMYEDYCRMSSRGVDMLAEEPLGQSRQELGGILYRMLTYFAGPMEKMMQMSQALRSGGDIAKYVSERCQQYGMVYPGGTGRTTERMRTTSLA